MPIAPVKPYVILLTWLKADVDVIAQVGTRIYEGGIPVDVARNLEPTKYINTFLSGGERHRRVWYYNPLLEIECVGPTTAQAWDVYMAVLTNHREQNRMVAVPTGQSYMFLLQEVSPGFDSVDIITEWPSVKSVWRLTHWEQTR